GVRAVARRLQPVPDGVGGASVYRVGGDRLLVVEELSELEDGAGALVGLDQERVAPGLATVGRGGGGDTGVVVPVGAGCGLAGRQRYGVGGAVRAEGYDWARRTVVGQHGERTQRGLCR